MLGSSSTETFAAQGRAEVEYKASHHRKKVFIAIKYRQTASHCISSIIKEFPCTLAQGQGRRTDKRYDGALTLDLKMQMKARPSKKRRIRACWPWGSLPLRKPHYCRPSTAPTTTSRIGPKATKAAPSRRKRRQSATTSLTDRPDVSFHLEPMVEGFDSQ
jgi:hypothetical protein